MAASEDLTARMHTVGARGVARDFRRVGRAADDTDKSTRNAAKGAGIFGSALAFLGTRMGAIIILGGLMAVTLGPALVAAIALLTPALIALGGIGLGVFGMVAGAALIFSKEAKTAGTAASYLSFQLKGMQTALMRAMKPGANKMMMGLARALETLEPVLAALRPAFTVFGEAIGTSLQAAAHGVAELGPKMSEFLTKSAALLPRLASLVGPFFGAMLDLGMAGIPVLGKLMDWLTSFVIWLGPAVRAAIAWEQQTHTLWGILQLTGGVLAWLGGVIGSLAVIVYKLYLQWQPFLAIVGGALLVAIRGLGDALKWASQNMQIVGPILTTLIGGFLAFKAVMMGLTAINWILGFLATLRMLLMSVWATLLMNPIVLIIVALVALGAGLVILYNKWGWFHRAVNNVWGALKSGYAWVKGNWPTLVAILTGPIGIAVLTIIRNFDSIKGAFRGTLNWIIDRLNSVIGWIDKAIGAFNKLPGHKDVGTIGTIGHMAQGGPVNRSGVYEVGERGRERVFLPKGAHVQPNGGGGGAVLGGDTYVHATLVMPDGSTLARQTFKAAKRKQSVR